MALYKTGLSTVCDVKKQMEKYCSFMTSSESLKGLMKRWQNQHHKEISKQNTLPVSCAAKIKEQ
jgi:hypothetical protein